MADAVKIEVKKTGRIRAPVLDHGALTRIGTEMLAAQKQRIGRGLNTSDSQAKPLSKPYLFKKAKIRRTNRPIRDLKLTGLLMENFTLRKAANGIVRAEPTSREARKHALAAVEKDAMIGFAGSDLKTVYEGAEEQYGQLAKKMWVPIG